MSTILTNKIETKSGGLTLDPGAGGSVTVLGSLAGTITTAAQTNITSVGTLSSLAVSGNLTVDTNTLFVDASTNNVGIGTSSPAVKLHTAVSSGVCTVKIHADHTSNPIAALELQRGTDDAWGVDAFGDYKIKNDAENLIFEYGASGVTTERLRIDSSGNQNVNYFNSAIHTYGSGAYGGKTVIKASTANALALINSTTGGAAQVAINFTNEFATNQYNYLARIIAEPTQAWTTNVATRDSDLSFFTTLNGATSEKLRILSSGGITFNGDTAATNALDDYEEGTFGAALYEDGGSTLSTDTTASYVKVGSLVHVKVTFFSGTSGGAGELRMNLPFAQGTDNVAGTAAFSDSNGGIVSHFAIDGNDFLKFSDSIGAIGVPNVSIGSDWGTASRYYFSFTYSTL